MHAGGKGMIRAMMNSLTGIIKHRTGPPPVSIDLIVRGIVFLCRPNIRSAVLSDAICSMPARNSITEGCGVPISECRLDDPQSERRLSSSSCSDAGLRLFRNTLDLFGYAQRLELQADGAYRRVLAEETDSLTEAGCLIASLENLAPDEVLQRLRRLGICIQIKENKHEKAFHQDYPLCPRGFVVFGSFLAFAQPAQTTAGQDQKIRPADRSSQALKSQQPTTAFLHPAAASSGSLRLRRAGLSARPVQRLSVRSVKS